MHVFVTSQNVLISYPLHGPDTRVRDVMEVIAKEVKIPIEDQELLLASGSAVDENSPAFQYVTDEVSCRRELARLPVRHCMTR